MNDCIVVGDFIDFNGGSKVATELLLETLEAADKQKIVIASVNVDSWSNSGYSLKKLRLPSVLAKKESGIGFFVKHLVLFLQLNFLAISMGKVKRCLATSGPGVDMALYWFAGFKNLPIIQMVHGPIASSGSIARCLLQAEKIFYLRSTYGSIIKCLTAKYHSAIVDKVLSRCYEFSNGINANHWPLPTRQQKPVIFWAASLLKWKGLDTLLDGLERSDVTDLASVNICYIQPKRTNLAVSEVKNLKNVFWYQEPENLDYIRASSSIFVSTSTREPFGLSILESLAAGLCVIIPADGAYWDEKLKHRVHCLKYRPGDVGSLVDQIKTACQDGHLRSTIGYTGKSIAQAYTANSCYRVIKESIVNPVPKRNTES